MQNQIWFTVHCYDKKSQTFASFEDITELLEFVSNFAYKSMKITITPYCNGFSLIDLQK